MNFDEPFLSPEGIRLASISSLFADLLPFAAQFLGTSSSVPPMLVLHKTYVPDKMPISDLDELLMMLNCLHPFDFLLYILSLQITLEK